MSHERQDFDNFADYWSGGPWSTFVERLHPGWDRPRTLVIQNQPAGSFPDPGFDEFCLQLVLRGRTKAHIAFGPERFIAQGLPGTMILAPPDTDTCYDVEGPHRLASLAIDKNTLARFREQCDVETPSDFGVLHSTSFVDPTIETLLQRMCAQAVSEHPASDLFLDDATNTILTSLFVRSSAIERPARKSRLSDAELARIRDLVEAQLEARLTISDLAAMTTLSDAQFARVFKETVGESPHQYVLGRRVRRACDLLEATAMPLAEIAFASGFASQSHMTDVFRQKVGTTPGRYRAAAGI